MNCNTFSTKRVHNEYLLLDQYLFLDDEAVNIALTEPSKKDEQNKEKGTKLTGFFKCKDWEINFSTGSPLHAFQVYQVCSGL